MRRVDPYKGASKTVIGNRGMSGTANNPSYWNGSYHADAREAWLGNPSGLAISRNGHYVYVADGHHGGI